MAFKREERSPVPFEEKFVRCSFLTSSLGE